MVDRPEALGLDPVQNVELGGVRRLDWRVFEARQGEIGKIQEVSMRRGCFRHYEVIKRDRKRILDAHPTIRNRPNRDKGRAGRPNGDDEFEVDGRRGGSDEHVGDLEDVDPVVIFHPDPKRLGRSMKSVVPLELFEQIDTDA